MPQAPEKGKRPAEGARGPAKEDDAAPPPATADGKGPGGLITTRRLGIVVVVLLVLQGAGVAYHIVARREVAAPESEISLGVFTFAANPSERGPVAKASFELYVAPLAESSREAKSRLAERKYRVRQDVEELLREAHGGDFVDPALGELKRRIQERINKTLGTRAVAEVIITGLEVQRGELERKAATQTAGPASWAEGPSS